MKDKPKQAMDIMLGRVETFAPDLDVRDAVSALLRRGYSGAPVVDGDGRLLGVLSEHDAVRVLAQSAWESWPSGTVGDHMSKDVETVGVEDDVFAIAQKFHSGKHRRLPVVDGGRLVGLITRRDLMRALDRTIAEKERGRSPTTYEILAARR